MNSENVRCSKILLISVYFYLVFPVACFLIGWCRWYIGIPLTVLLLFGAVLCLAQHGFGKLRWCRLEVLAENGNKIFFALALITGWVVLSGIGAQVWQNDDHWWRNTIFDMLVKHDWPVVSTVDFGDRVETRGIVYYIAFWLPSALVGKLFGLDAGYLFQIAWAIFGVVIVYALICTWRGKVDLWPLVLMILFSGLDYVGYLLILGDGVSATRYQILTSSHLERWASHAEYLGMTTNLYWIFNHAVPAWVMSAFLFLYEKPKNMVYLVAVSLLSCIFACVGILPMAVYFMIVRADWKEHYKSFLEWLGDLWKNWISLQNLVVALLTAAVMILYYTGNSAYADLAGKLREKGALLGLILIAALFLLLLAVYLCVSRKKTYLLRYAAYLLLFNLFWILLPGCMDKHWKTIGFTLAMLLLFYFLETEVLTLFLDKTVISKNLLLITKISLFMIPLFRVGRTIDFCMKVSLPGLFLLMLFAILSIDKNTNRWRTALLIAVLAVGAISPLHEIKRSVVNSRAAYEIRRVEEREVLSGYNFSAGTDGIFWKYLAK